jgi:hypothetical protein
MGYRLLVIPGVCQMAAIAGARLSLATLREQGTLVGIADRLATFEDSLAVTDLAVYQRLEREFGG